MIFISACSTKNNINTQNINKQTNSFTETFYSEDKKPINEKKKIIIEKDYSKFDLIPTAERIKTSTIVGKSDPFSNSINLEKQLLFPEIELRGIIFTKKESSAIVKYNNKSGEVRIGDVGGITTNLLPNGIKLIKINLLKENVVIMNSESKKFKLKLYKL